MSVHHLFLVVCCAGLFVACSDTPDGYNRVEEGVFRRMHRFGDGKTTASEAFFLSLRVDLRIPGNDIFDYYLELEGELASSGWDENDLLRREIGGMVAGDSISWLVPYAQIKGSFIDDYAADEKVLPDTTRIALSVSVVHAMTEADYLSSNLYRRKMRKAEELRAIRRILDRSGIAGDMKSYAGGWYRILQEGQGDQPMAGDELTLGYAGYFLDSTQFDLAADSATWLYFPYGKPDQVVPGIEKMVGYMRKGERRELWLTSDHAFGERGSKGIVPPNTPVRFEVELIDILRSDSLSQMKKSLD